LELTSLRPEVLGWWLAPFENQLTCSEIIIIIIIIYVKS
jgi:hypothetical protein